MRIVHVSYDYIPFEDPHKWMQAIPFFTGIAMQMARRQETFSVHCINYEGVIESEKASFYFVKGNKRQKFFPLKVNRQVQKLNPDVVIVHGFHFLWSILWLRMFVGSPVKIFIQHHAEKPFQFPKKYLQLWVDKVVTGYFFAAADLAATWIKAGLIKKSSKIYEVTEASSAFRPMDRGQAQARTHVQGLRTYLWVGRFDGNKDPLTLIKAFLFFAKNHNDVRLYVIYQQDDLLEEVRALLKDYSEQIILVGKIPHAELVYWFNSVDFIISTSHYESGGIAVCEGMSCGCIPILSDIPSFKKMIDGGRCGFFFTPGDANSLLDVLEKSYKIPIENERRKVLEQFEKQLSFQAIAEKMITVAANANN
jgi:glycosyltransferase involved in cell wall biosynthesis